MGPGKQLSLGLAQVFLAHSGHLCDLLRNHFVALHKPHILGQSSETPSLPHPGLKQHLAMPAPSSLSVRTGRWGTSLLLVLS